MKPTSIIPSYPPDTFTCTNPVRQITAASFKRSVKRNPDWAAKLTGPVEIIDYCDMGASEITHLSPWLMFSGRDDGGNVASFAECEQLTVAEGTFHGYVDFSGSGIVVIGRLNITRPNDCGVAADFDLCEALRVAEGRFPGAAGFMGSGIETIGDMEILAPAENGAAAEFSWCKNLLVARGRFPGSVNFTGAGIETIGDLSVTAPCEDGVAASFEKCKNLRAARGDFHGWVTFEESGIKEIADLVLRQTDIRGRAASFNKCAELMVARGRYPAFDGSSVVKIADDFEVLAIPGDSCAVPQASFAGCCMRWGCMSRMCLRKIVQHRYIGIWEEAAANLDAQLRAKEALRDPGIEL